jgi:hypothetical protein
MRWLRLALSLSACLVLPRCPWSWWALPPRKRHGRAQWQRPEFGYLRAWRVPLLPVLACHWPKTSRRSCPARAASHALATSGRTHRNGHAYHTHTHTIQIDLRTIAVYQLLSAGGAHACVRGEGRGWNKGGRVPSRSSHRPWGEKRGAAKSVAALNATAITDTSPRCPCFPWSLLAACRSEQTPLQKSPHTVAPWRR